MKFKSCKINHHEKTGAASEVRHLDPKEFKDRYFTAEIPKINEAKHIIYKYQEIGGIHEIKNKIKYYEALIEIKLEKKTKIMQKNLDN